MPDLSWSPGSDKNALPLCAMLFPSLFNNIIILSALTIVALLCILSKKLTPAAALAAIVVGWLIFAGAGYVGELQLFTFFVLSVLATRHGRALKGKAHGEQRDAFQVFANGGVAAILAVFAMIDYNHTELYTLMIAGSLAAALADTLSSELGMVYGKRTFNILTFKKEEKGLDGVISIEGTLIGAAGAFIIAMIYMWNRSLWIITVAGVGGNIIDSILGATLERKGIMGNNAVNFLNTLTGALMALLLY
ncbi:DUF92 domain-containing protein [Chitinophaga sancti]|uniref:DUF92 domain-containing protein n=1 Tax=Chitinophaga sancti TaxID=1004 RepID=A0A1K1QXU8_9BACT|nr:DUF92 domain-containing protein [Chitinophaga sancti]WQD62043.1 DUF92 domain-containing protein [Chitinophaga sancti]WQG92388.1 DUF92 domain-containing protein [Chitinophaga sancti]SFW64516.1 TIGR00297 family protein [Chitinophaga sancti]